MSLEGGLIKIDLREPRRALAASLRELRRAKRLVVSDSEILGGDPVIRGTRVPVHMIGELIAQGSTPAEPATKAAGCSMPGRLCRCRSSAGFRRRSRRPRLTEGYFRLTTEMIRLAPIYAAAYPLCGRPRRQPWHDQQSVHRRRRKLDTIAISSGS